MYVVLSYFTIDIKNRKYKRVNKLKLQNKVSQLLSTFQSIPMKIEHRKPQKKPEKVKHEARIRLANIIIKNH